MTQFFGLNWVVIIIIIVKCFNRLLIYEFDNEIKTVFTITVISLSYMSKYSVG